MPWGTEAKDEVIVGKQSDVRSVTITLESGFFAFMFVKIVDKDKVERYAFGEGEEIFYNCEIKNQGKVTDTFVFTIIDEDTGKEVDMWSTDVPPGKTVEWVKTPIRDIPKMPGKDLHLKFSVTP